MTHQNNQKCLEILKHYGVSSQLRKLMVQAGDVLVDYDKLIDRQLERATVSVISGFAKLFNDASVVLNV